MNLADPVQFKVAGKFFEFFNTMKQMNAKMFCRRTVAS